MLTREDVLLSVGLLVVIIGSLSGVYPYLRCADVCGIVPRSILGNSDCGGTQSPAETLPKRNTHS